MNKSCLRPQLGPDPKPLRRGIVLVLVMIVVVMISLAGFGFVASMSNENKAVHLRGEQLQMENAIASAEEFLKQYLQRSQSTEPSSQSLSTAQSTISASSTDDEETLMRGVVVADEEGPLCRVRFSVMAPHYDETGTSGWRYGLERESTRLDLHAVMEWEYRRPGTGRLALMALPEMTEAVADAILDWMDRDVVPRQSGAEADYYATQNPPYSPRNGIPDSLEELLLVKGVTRSALFGHDANQNHRLDLDEQSSTSVSPARDASGDSSLPWSELLTLFSGERNQSRDGQPRINLNQPDLGQMHRQMTQAFDVKVATYAALYRQFGPYMGVGTTVDVGTVKVNFVNPPKFFLPSPLDLLQSRVMVPVAPGIFSVVGSPFPSDREKLQALLGILYDRTTVSDAPVLKGRVNVNLAPPEVLRAIPGFDKALADQIVTSRGAGSKRDRRHDDHPCWLFTENLINLDKMKAFFPYLTVGGDVYRGQIVAFSEASRLSQRVEVVLDASSRPARRLFWKDLQVLGRGYPWDVLDTPGGISTSPNGASNATSFSY